MEYSSIHHNPLIISSTWYQIQVLMAVLDIVDFHHPLFLHPSDTLGTLLVSLQITKIENYSVWSSLFGTGVTLFVFSWILNTVSEDLSASIVFASSVALVWKDLQERFDKVDATHLQGIASTSVYFSKLKILSDEYEALVPFSTYVYAISRKNRVHVQQQRLLQFLMGLNESYATAYSQNLLMQPFSFLNQAYSVLLQEESQRMYSSTFALSEPTTLYSSNGQGSSKKSQGPQMRELLLLDWISTRFQIHQTQVQFLLYCK
ncbi:UBN2_3 domain-containing protein [Gossypium australe]|uniref:UBN2_3 domain-containing protein n=1 Tax=Gossypium australe TaxID=47621 RepID=A0A5B6URD9_9ROSI|nr:UBN2_3 domain-containing protein [Gossypium australe]KAA3458642.1 UBN2_3 domain-containing protein [Gossypium australe]